MNIEISICTYKDGKFDIIFKDEDGRELIFSGVKKMSKEALEFALDIAPPCVYTSYSSSKEG